MGRAANLTAKSSRFTLAGGLMMRRKDWEELFSIPGTSMKVTGLKVSLMERVIFWVFAD